MARMESLPEVERTYLGAEAGWLSRRIDRIRDYVQQYLEVVNRNDQVPADLQPLGESLLAACDVLKKRLSPLQEAEHEEQQESAYVMNSVLQAALVDVDAIVSSVQSGGTATAQERVSGWAIGLKQQLQGALHSLWKLVSGLLRPKEWSVRGELQGGVMPFGLAKASAEIKFGP